MNRTKIKKHFLTGVFATLPLFATIYILYLIYKIIAGIVRAILPIDIITNILVTLNDNLKQKEKLIAFLVFLINVIIFILVVYVVGVFINKFINKGATKYIDRLMNKIPVAKSIYSIVKQIIDTFFTKEKGYEKAKVVLVEFPRDGIYTLAFIANEKNDVALNASGENDIVNIFIPGTPNPGNGFFLMVPKNKLIDVDYTYEEAFKLIMSAGALEPERNDENEKN